MNRRKFTLIAATSLIALPAQAARAATSPLVIVVPGGALPPGFVGSIYGGSLTTLGGGERPVTWSIVAGSLPAGLSIIKNWGNSSTMITGTPTKVQVATFTVQARDKSGNTARANLSITVNASR